MGTAHSTPLNDGSNECEDDPWWPKVNSEQIAKTPANETQETTISVASATRERRQQILAAKRKEIELIRENLQKQIEENKYLRSKVQNFYGDSEDMDLLLEENIQLKQENANLRKELLASENYVQKNQELQNELEEIKKDIENMNNQVLVFEEEREKYRNHVVALKEVIKVSKEMIAIREDELMKLKEKVAIIENSFTERETQTMCLDLRNEYERQLRNIRNLRNLYEERARVAHLELKNKIEELSKLQQQLDIETTKSTELEQRISELEDDVSNKYDEISSLQSNLGLAKAEFRDLENEMIVINQLFAQTLIGFNSCQGGIDLDKLIELLEENQDLLSDIVVKEESSETSSALPKLLLDLLSQVCDNKSKECSLSATESCSQNSENVITESAADNNHINSAKEIVSKLPKVWKVLIELLRQQTVQPVEINSEANPCYKSVETPAGTRHVLSLSQTYIHLKDLILEKKFLQKEMLKMKKLNCHLEVRLHDQEKRLEEVSTELGKTWHLVDRMQRQHEQLHTHEKILRYELSQKRKLLTELKAELEYCREKWGRARERNCESEHQCRELRAEFASRRAQVVVDDYSQNSIESGFSDEHEGLSETDSDFHEEPHTDTVDCASKASDVDDAEEATEFSKTDQHPTAEILNPVESIETLENSENSNTDNSITNRFATDCTEQSLHNSKDDTKVSLENIETNTESLEPTNPGPSGSSNLSPEEILARREARFKRLEEQCVKLKNKYADQAQRGSDICNKLELLHEQYGSNGKSSQENKENDTASTSSQEDASTSINQEDTENGK